MDIVSHAGWGYAALRRRGKKAAWWGALAGAAPDLLAFVPPMVVRVGEHGWAGFSRGGGQSNPNAWRAGGPPLPQEWADIYSNYYVYTHSLVILGLVLGVLYLMKRRELLWFGIPYALHILMDIPTHERFQTPFLYPLSRWTVQGINWGHPLIFWPNWAALIGTLIYLPRRYRLKNINCRPSDVENQPCSGNSGSA